MYARDTKLIQHFGVQTWRPRHR